MRSTSLSTTLILLLLTAACSDPPSSNNNSGTDTQTQNDASLDAGGDGTGGSDTAEDTGGGSDTAEDTGGSSDVIIDDGIDDTAGDASDDATGDDAAIDAADDATATADVEDTVGDVADDASDAADDGTDTVTPPDDAAGGDDTADAAGGDDSADATGGDDTADATGTDDTADATGGDDSADASGGEDTADAAGSDDTADSGPVGPCPAGSDGKPCDDGDACSSGDACGGGVCLAGAATSCDDGDLCTVDACDKAVGCTHTAKSGCTSCKEAKDCDDANVCTTDVCDLAIGCTSTAADGACSDGDACTEPDVCAGGACKAGGAKSCNDNNPCTTDSCSPTSGCEHKALADGAVCGDQKVCTAGTCAPKAPPGLPSGAVVITEVMFDPKKVSDGVGEWIEVYNPGDKPVSLVGMVLKDKTQSHTIASNSPVLVPPKGYAVLGINADEKVNGGVKLDYAYSKLALGNTDGVVRIENGDGTLIDEVAYKTGAGSQGWPGKISGRSIQLAADSFAADKNDDGSNWCFTSKTFGDGDAGTPGAAPQSCVVGWCRFQWNPSVTLKSGEGATWYARVWAEGITDQTDGTDVSGDLTGDFGIGAPTTLPWVDSSWAWVELAPNTQWSAGSANEPNNDEYQVELKPKQAPGTYATAFRFFLRGSTRAVYCDKAAGPGKDGAEDGYQTEQAGLLTIIAN